MRRSENSLSLLLLVLLLGGLMVLGYTLFKVKLNPLPQVSEYPAVSTPLATVDLDDLDMTLPFAHQTVRLERRIAGQTEATFWNKQPIQVPAELAGQDFYAISDQFEIDDLIYDPVLDTYYFFEPGGYQTFRIVSQAQIDQTAKFTEQYVDPEFGTISYRECAYREPPDQPDQTGWLAITCRDSYTMPDIPDQVFPGGSVTSCYLPLEGSESYLAFDQPSRPVGSDSDLCSGLDWMGIEKAISQP